MHRKKEEEEGLNRNGKSYPRERERERESSLDATLFHRLLLIRITLRIMLSKLDHSLSLYLSHTLSLRSLVAVYVLTSMNKSCVYLYIVSIIHIQVHYFLYFSVVGGGC